MWLRDNQRTRLGGFEMSKLGSLKILLRGVLSLTATVYRSVDTGPDPSSPYRVVLFLSMSPFVESTELNRTTSPGMSCDCQVEQTFPIFDNKLEVWPP
jgi:hypothetical protein